MRIAIDEFMITRHDLEIIDAVCIDTLERAQVRVRAHRTWEDHVRYLSTPVPVNYDGDDDLMWDWCTRPTNPIKKERQ